VSAENTFAAVRVLAATLVDHHGDESHEEVRTARSIAGRMSLADCTARDLEGFEQWCLALALAALDAAHPTEPPPPSEPPVLCPSCGAPLTWNRLDGSTAYYCACPGYGAGAPTT
jgi:hypothetical protein